MTLYLEAKVMWKKVLGTLWLSERDTITLMIKTELAKETAPLRDPDVFIPVKLTKRLIPSKLAGIFDPGLEQEPQSSSNPRLQCNN